MNSAASTANCHHLVTQGANLFRDSTSSVFYCIFKAAGKQIKKSLHTANHKLARRRPFERGTTTNAKTLPFAEDDSNASLISGLAHRGFTLKSLKWKPTVLAWEEPTVKDLAGYFGAVHRQSDHHDHVETWAKQRAAGIDRCAGEISNSDSEAAHDSTRETDIGY